MIDFETEKMTIDGETWHPISKWAVWFMTPFGIVNNLPDAIRTCKRRNIDPDTVIPVCVAMINDLTYEIVRR